MDTTRHLFGDLRRLENWLAVAAIGIGPPFVLPGSAEHKQQSVFPYDGSCSIKYSAMWWVEAIKRSAALKVVLVGWGHFSSRRFKLKVREQLHANLCDSQPV
jgi:hypothetical protein